MWGTCYTHIKIKMVKTTIFVTVLMYLTIPTTQLVGTFY